MSSNVKKFDHSQFYTLSAVAWACCRDIKAGKERFEDMLHHATEGWREFSFDVSHEVKWDEIEMETWKAIKFPCDMVDWTKIGFRVGDQLLIFVNDPDIPKGHDVVNGVKQENKPIYLPSLLDTSAVVPFFGDFGLDGLMSSTLYGLAVKENYLGYFDADWKQREFNFKSVVNNYGNKVYLEYITDGINPTGKTIIHPYAHRALKLWVHWNRKLNDDRYSDGERDRAEDRYNNAMQNLAIRMLDMSIDDIKDAMRHQYQATPKQ